MKNTFNNEWKHYLYKNNIQVSDNLEILKNNNDTIELRFKNQNIQHKFEKEWKKYTGQKFKRMLSNTKKR
ncbi:MAG: hypothetical protein J6S57_03350 [Alphaproteobacteria bacterium]|nr:hypothetical protein [Alphaproteobacteria bacterium]